MKSQKVETKPWKQSLFIKNFLGFTSKFEHAHT